MTADAFQINLAQAVRSQGPTRRDVAARLAAFAWLLGGAQNSLAQGTPANPIRVISAFGAGLGPDLTLRILAEKLSAQTGRQIIIDPRPGGNGLVAFGALKQAPADGHTLLLISNAHAAINPHLFASAAYKVDGVLEPVSTIYRAPFYIAVGASSPHKSLAQLLAHARAVPGQVTYSIPYTGSPPHMGCVLLEHLTATRMLAIPYKDNQLTTSVASGEVDFTMATLGSLSALVKGGKLRLLAIAQPSRSLTEPAVPTAEESGGPKELVVQSWVGLMTHKGAPPDVVGRISQEVRRALASPDLADRYTAAGYLPAGSTPAQMAEQIKDDDKFYGSLIKRIGMKAE